MDSGEILELEIASVAYRGAGVARHSGVVVFVPRALPGERILAEVTALKKNYATARLVKILEASPNRIDSVCIMPDGSVFPGCAYDNATHAAEIAMKDAQLRDFLRKLPLDDAAFLEPFASPDELHYRNKAVFHIDGSSAQLVAGYYGEDNRTIVDVKECPLSSNEINKLWARVRTELAASGRRPGKVTIRSTEADGAVSWCDDATPPNHPFLMERTPVGDLAVPIGGFFQVNPGVSRALVEQVGEWLASIAGDGIDFALDLYCGVGPFALMAAKLGYGRVLGVEDVRQAVACAKDNALRLGQGGARFRCADVVRYLACDARSIPWNRTVAIADPPRSGIPRAALERLLATPLRHAIFVSCDPATLARDLTLAVGAGFCVRNIRLFDMFPRTIHFESAVLLERK